MLGFLFPNPNSPSSIQELFDFSPNHVFSLAVKLESPELVSKRLARLGACLNIFLLATR